MANGGRRPGAGRKPGTKNPATLEKERVLAELRQRIMKIAQRILDSQTSIALGQQFLYRIDTDPKTKHKSRPELITDEETIRDFLDGEFGDGQSINTDTEYYFITTKEPNNFAIDSMLDRTFGKAKQGELDVKVSLPTPILGNVRKNNRNRQNS